MSSHNDDGLTMRQDFMCGREASTSPRSSRRRGKKHSSAHGERHRSDHAADGTRMVKLHGDRGSEDGSGGDDIDDDDDGHGVDDRIAGAHADDAMDDERCLVVARIDQSRHHQHRKRPMDRWDDPLSPSHQQQAQASERGHTSARIRRDYSLNEGDDGERDHLLLGLQPAQAGRHQVYRPTGSLPSSTSLSSFSAPPTPSSSSSSVTTFATFTTTSTSSTSISAYTASSTASIYSVSSSPSQESSNSVPSLQMLSSSSPSPYPSPASSPPSRGAKKRVKWIDELEDGNKLEEVIEVERYLKQRGSLGWWIELVLENKIHFLVLLVIFLLFIGSFLFIFYKLLF